MAEVPAQKTPISLESLAGLVVDSLTRKLGEPPTRELASMSLVHMAFETGSGQKSIANALGNIMAAGFANGVERFLWKGDFWRPPWFRDTSHPIHGDMLQGEQPSAFRAYSGHALAVDDYVNLLFSPKYALLLAAAKSGDPAEFTSAIAQTGYTNKLDIPGSTKTIRSLLQQVDAKGLFASLPKGHSPGGPPSSSPEAPGGSGGAPPSVLAGIDISDLPILRQGDKGGHVALWQKLLGIAITGVFDFTTVAVTSDWQSKHALTVDGVVGPKQSWRRMLSS